MNDHRSGRGPISAAQWSAARAVAEGAPPTRKLVAAVLGCDDSVVYARAGEEGWKRLDFRSSTARAAHRDFIETVSAYNAPDDGDWDDWSADGRAVGGRAAEEGGGEAEDGAEPDPAEDAFGEAGADGEADDPLELVARAARLTARRLAALLRRAERGGRLNKPEIDGLLALARMTERWEALARERAMQEETHSDEELAQTLRIIDERIIELAHEEAERMLAEGYRPRLDLPGGE